MTWVLLIYTVPAKPSRLRAAIWRSLKSAGAEYLRDGVCVLPEHERTVAALRAIAAQVVEYGGSASVAESVRFDERDASAITAQLAGARAAEYDEVAADATHLVDHLRHEALHRDVHENELAELRTDLVKLRRWCDQVKARDYLDVPAAARAAALLDQAEGILAEHGVQSRRRAEVSG